MDEDDRSGLDRLLHAGEQAKRAWEVGSFVITAGTTVLAFISDVGGPIQFLVEVSAIGFAAYVALFVVVVPMFYLLQGVEKVTKRESTDTATFVVIGLAAVVGAAVIRFGLFDQRAFEDLDAIGTAFSVLVGIAVLLVPVFVLWYTRGSRPAAS